MSDAMSSKKQKTKRSSNTSEASKEPNDSDRATAKSDAAMETQNVLMEVYWEMYSEDPSIAIECFRAKTDEREGLSNDKIVNRRGPLTILDKSRALTDDPALQNNPLSGRLVMTYCSTAALLMVFLQALCLQRTRSGKSFIVPLDTNKMLGPDNEVLYDLGGLNVNAIRNSGETFRLFWAMWMHAGWVHIILNIICQLQFLVMFEPDWGTLRCVILFVVSGITGNLISAVSNPCATTVGSSGALYGLMGAMFVYCMEYWTTIPRPGWMIGFSVIVVVASLLTGFTSYTDNWAHVGGLIGGLCLSLTTVQSFDSLREKRKGKTPIISHLKPQGLFRIRVAAPGGAKAQRPRQQKKKKRACPFLGRVADYFVRNYSCGLAETITRIIASHVLIATWVVCFLLIYVAYDYQPTGQITYSGILSCCCCYGPNKMNNWTCFPCDLDLHDNGPGKSTWEMYCRLPLARKKNFGLKREYVDKSLYSSIGLESKSSQSIVTPNKLVINPDPEPVERLDLNNKYYDQQEEIKKKQASKSNKFLLGISGQSSLDDLIELASVSPDKQIDFTTYFENDLTPEELKWLRSSEKRYIKRIEMITDLLDKFMHIDTPEYES